jgi:hypothetical protein
MQGASAGRLAVLPGTLPGGPLGVNAPPRDAGGASTVGAAAASGELGWLAGVMHEQKKKKRKNAPSLSPLPLLSLETPPAPAPRTGVRPRTQPWTSEEEEGFFAGLKAWNVAARAAAAASGSSRPGGGAKLESVVTIAECIARHVRTKDATQVCSVWRLWARAPRGSLLACGPRRRGRRALLSPLRSCQPRPDAPF